MMMMMIMMMKLVVDDAKDDNDDDDDNRGLSGLEEGEAMGVLLFPFLRKRRQRWRR